MQRAHAERLSGGQPSSGADRYFAIPPQPLSQALTAYGDVTGLAALVDSGLTVGRQSSGVRGYYSPPEALRLLLRGSGLSAVYTSANAFTLVTAPETGRRRPPAADNSGDISTPGLGGNLYAAVIQRAVQQALCRTPETRPGRYRAVLQLWINDRGGVVNALLPVSTGLPRRDKVILDHMRSLPLGPPRMHLPQPLTILLLPSANSGKECQAFDPSPPGLGE